MSINKVLITGNLTRDPELKSTTGGTSVLTFGVAVNDRRRNPQSGEWEDFANFVDCVIFGARADSLSRFLAKGTKVAIEGKLRYSSWERDGQRRSKLEIVVDEIEFLSPRSQGGQGSPAPRQQYSQADPNGYAAPAPAQQSYAAPAPQPTAPVQAPPSADVYDEDIPF